MTHMKRASFTLPPEVLQDLAYVASRLGSSKSAIVAEVLGSTLGPLTELLRVVPDESALPPEETVRRLRGASGALIRERLDHLRDVVESLDDPDGFELTPCDDRPAGCSCDYSSGERVPPARGCLVHGGRGR